MEKSSVLVIRLVSAVHQYTTCSCLSAPGQPVLAQRQGLVKQTNPLRFDSASDHIPKKKNPVVYQRYQCCKTSYETLTWLAALPILLQNHSGQCQCPLLDRTSDSMQENTMLVALGKEDGKRRGGNNKGRKTRGRERGEGDEGITKLKTNVISAAAERKPCLVLGESCLAVCSRGWVQHCAMICS